MSFIVMDLYAVAVEHNSSGCLSPAATTSSSTPIEQLLLVASLKLSRYMVQMWASSLTVGSASQFVLNLRSIEF